jgi:hypothetical protein
MPEGAVYVGRPTVYGNPFEVIQLPCGCWENRDDNGVTYMHHYPIHELGHPPITKSEAIENSVRLFYEDLTQWLGGRMKLEAGLADAVAKLRGHDLACWCPLNAPCHADVLLQIANGGDA